jgi:hypothetical protein
LTVVASIPTVTVVKPSGVVLSAGTAKIAQVTLQADAAGSVQINTLPLVITTSTHVSLTTSTLVLKDTGGVSVSTAADDTNCHAMSACSLVLTNGLVLAAGESKTLYLYATIGSTNGAWGTAGQEYVTTALGAAASFSWTDINGNSGTLTGASIYGYSTDAINVTN